MVDETLSVAGDKYLAFDVWSLRSALTVSKAGTPYVRAPHVDCYKVE